MNAIILCGGSQGHGLTLKEEIEDRYHPSISEIPWRFEEHGHQEREFKTKADFSLGKETIIQRTVRLLQEQNITDITVAWTYAKPVVSGVSFRKVEYRGGAVSTILQCQDLIEETIIVLGDAVFSREALEEILRQSFNGILIALSYMILTKPAGAKRLKQFFDRAKEKIMGEKLGYDQHYLHWICLRYPFFYTYSRMFIGRHFIMDCDTPKDARHASIIISDYLDKGEAAPEINGWQKRFVGMNLGPYPDDKGWIIEVAR
jgi:hypothetical protein